MTALTLIGKDITMVIAALALIIWIFAFAVIGLDRWRKRKQPANTGGMDE